MASDSGNHNLQICAATFWLGSQVSTGPCGVFQLQISTIYSHFDQCKNSLGRK